MNWGVETYRELAAADPDQYRPDVADSLYRLGVVLAELGRPAAALPVAEEAVATYRELAAANPDQYHPDLPHSLAALSTIRQKLCQTADDDSMHAEVAQVIGTDS